MIQQGTHLTELQKPMLLSAIRDYQSLQSVFTCYRRLAHTLSLFEISVAEIYIREGELEQAAEYFTRARQSMEQYLACAPTDGKAWLDYALLLLEEKGMDEDVIAAWKNSAKVTPFEGWLAEKRLHLAIRLLPFFDAEARKLALADVATLKNTLLRRQLNFLKATGFASLEELEGFLAAHSSSSTTENHYPYN